MRVLLNNSFSFLLILSIMVFFSCSKDSDEPEQTEKNVTTQDLSITMDENPTNGQVIGTLSGTTNKGTVSFSIIEQSPQNSFSIDAVNGELKVADASVFNFEINPTITGMIKVANGNLFEIAAVTINLNDLEEDRVYEGDVILTTQIEVNDFGEMGFTHITGGLLIGSYLYDDIVDLSPLLNIERIGQTLQISDCSSLTTTKGLKNISYIGGNIMINDNPMLEAIPDLRKLTILQAGISIGGSMNLMDISGLSQVTKIKGDFQLYDTSLTNLNAFKNLKTIEGRFLIMGNLYLVNLDSLLNLNDIGSKITISFNEALTNLDGLTSVTATIPEVIIYQNTRLENINGLQNIKFTEQIEITNNFSLINLNGLSRATSPSRIDIINNRSLISLSGLNNITAIGEGGFYIEKNYLLKNLNNLDRISIIEGPLSIERNILLKDFCALNDLITEGSFGTYLVLRNLYNPTIQDIIDGNCNI
ncbi:hypothetical protein [Aequorivita marina]|uniref:hypothetical protein n=1 Tax=Aequorivita marina TaxID=3073654 RepID=UPI00287718C9|nr:hypothetical protein [Aequorivita sp. S2608]MDS1298795.1 hypothetical protein [Aequorivita sp. S2608]